MSLWCRSALAAGVLQRADIGYELAPHMATLLRDAGAPGFVGALFPLVQQPEMFDHFEQRLSSGERTWWDRTSPDWITGVAATGRPFYSRLVPGGLAQVPGLGERLRDGCRVVDTAPARSSRRGRRSSRPDSRAGSRWCVARWRRCDSTSQRHWWSTTSRCTSVVTSTPSSLRDQLLPRTAYDDLLTRHGFEGLGHFHLTPVHAVTYGRTPAASARQT